MFKLLELFSIKTFLKAHICNQEYFSMNNLSNLPPDCIIIPEYLKSRNRVRAFYCFPKLRFSKNHNIYTSSSYLLESFEKSF